jgi:hypothetical protein
MSLLLQVLGTLAFANTANLPVAQVPADASCYATVDAAAIDALQAAMLLPSDIEHGGAIYEREGCYVFSAPVTNYKPMAVLFKVRTSSLSRLAGIYHTHTLASGPSDHYSAADVVQARYSRVPSFIGVHGHNHIRKLPPQHLPPAPITEAERALLGGGDVRGVVLSELPPPAAPIKS